MLGLLSLMDQKASAIELREVQRTQYAKYMPFYSYFIGDSLIAVDDASAIISMYALADITKAVYTSHEDTILHRTLNGKAILQDGLVVKYPNDTYVFDDSTLSLVPLEQAKDILKDDYYYCINHDTTNTGYVADGIKPILINNEFVKDTDESLDFYYDVFTGHDDMIQDQATIPEHRKQLREIYEILVNSNDGFDYRLEMYFRLGNHQNGLYGFTSFSDDHKWTVNTCKAKKPERLWRVPSMHSWGSYEFQIPYWHFLNPRFVVGPYEAHAKTGSGPECEMYNLGILDTKGNAVTNNIVWLLDLDVSANGRYLIVTGVEDKGNSTKWDGPYPTILYEVTYSGIITDNGVRLRDSPGTAGNILKTMKKGQQCTVLEHSKTRQTIDGVKECWYKIRLSDKSEGWVFGAWLDYW